MSNRKSASFIDEITDMFLPSEPEPITHLPTWLLGKSVPCFLCKRELEVRLSKKNRPYCICHDCLIQIFIRGERGINRLAQLIQER